MHDIELAINNKEVFVSTRLIAEKFNKANKKVNRKVFTIIFDCKDIEQTDELNDEMNIEVLFDKFSGSKKGTPKCIEFDDMKCYLNYYENRGKLYPEILVNEALFNELVMGFTGKEARKYRVEFRNQFKLMREQLQKIANGEGDFVDTLKLTRHSVEKYLPQFLTYKNVDTVLPKLVDRCISELDKGTIKIDILTSAIRVARAVRDQLDGVAEKEIMNKYIEKAFMKKEHVSSSRLGGVAKANSELKAKCKRLEDKTYEDQDFFDYIDTLFENKELQIYKQNMNMYVGYISKVTGKDQRTVYRAVYSNVISKYCNLYVPTAKSVKEAGYKSLVEYFYITQGIELLNEFASEGESWANKLGFGTVDDE